MALKLKYKKTLKVATYLIAGWHKKIFFFVVEVYVILTVEYGRNENIHIITSDNPLYFVMRREVLNDKIQWIIGYIP